MSGVYARNRKQTHFDPVDVAARLQDAVTLYVMNEKRIPKRWRQLVGVPLVEAADKISDCAIAANETWPDEKHIDRRRDYWRMTITACKQLDRKLARAQNVIPSATSASMADILELLDKEIGLAMHHRDNDKVIPVGGKGKNK